MRSLFIALMVLATLAHAQDSVKISGKIQNPKSDSVKVMYNDNVIAYYPKEFFARVDKKGNFSIQFPVPAGIYIQAELTHGKGLAEIMLCPGDSLNVMVDAARFDSSIHFTGRGSNVQNFMVSHNLAKGHLNDYTLKLKTAINKEQADFLKSIDAEQKAEIDFLNKNKQGLPKLFVNYWTAYFQYYNYFFIQQYPQIHEMIKRRRYTDTVPHENYDVIKSMAYAFNDTLLQVPSYLLYLTGIADVKLKAAGYVYLGKDKEKMEQMQDSANNLALHMLPPKSAEYFMAQNLYGRARNQDIARTEAQFTQYKLTWPSSAFTPVIQKQVTLAERLTPGQPAPDFEIKTEDGKTIHLSDLRGKVVHIGFWANWCKQCVAEMAAEKKVKEMIRNKPLEFVYVSISTDTAADRAIITKLQTTGLFTHTAGAWNAPEAQLYGIQALPAYFLVDEDGNLAPQPAPPTKSTQLILNIEKLFK